MKMKSLMRLACLGAVAMTFVACEEDKHICTLPSFAGFVLNLRYGMREIRLRLRQYSKVWGIYCIRLNTIGVWNVRIRLSLKIIMWCMMRINPIHILVSGFRTIFAVEWPK